VVSSKLVLRVLLGTVIMEGGRDCSTLAIESVINVKVWGSSLFATSTAFVVGSQLKPPCLVLMAVSLNPPLFPNPGENYPSFLPPC